MSLRKKILLYQSGTSKNESEDEVDGIEEEIFHAKNKKEKNLLNNEEALDSRQKDFFKEKAFYTKRKTFDDLNDLGQVRVHLVRARGLHSADFIGKSDPFAVLAIGDMDFKSKLIKRDLDPFWDEHFIFPIADIDDVLTITINDDDRFNDPEFLGKVQIPLLDLLNYPPNEDVTFALKNKKLTLRAKGHHPQIVLRFELQWNCLRAAIKTIRRRSAPTPDALKKSLLINNVQRCRRVLHFVNSLAAYIQSCFDWEKPSRSIKAFIIFETIVYFFHPVMIPLFFIAFILVYPMYASMIIIDWLDPYKDLEDDDEDEEKEDKKSLSEKYKAIQEVTTSVQNSLGGMASSAERFKNVLTYSTPFMSRLALAFLFLAAFILYLIPFRTIVMLYGVNKFSKKLIRPNHIPSSEFLNFLSRMPDDVALKKWKPLSVFDQDLLKEEEDERLKRERSTHNRLVKRVSSLFNKEANADHKTE